MGGGEAGIRMVIFQMNTEMDCWIYSDLCNLSYQFNLQ